MSSEFKLTYDKGIRSGDDRYSIAIPDNFVLEEGTEDRAFIAWLPDGADDCSSPRISLYDGKTSDEDDVDSRIYTPEVCAAIMENMFWNNPIFRMMYQDARFIPLNEGYPAGGINAAYEEGCCQYLIQVYFKNCIKTLRVQVIDVSEKDIPACDNMVIDWVKTMKITEPMDPLKQLDDESFYSTELSETIVGEWKACLNVHYSIIMQTLHNRINARAACYKANASMGEDSPENVRKDDQAYVDAAAQKTKDLWEHALDGLEKMAKANLENPLLQGLYKDLHPLIMRSDSVVMDNPGGIKGKVSAMVDGYESRKARFLVLMPNAEEKVEKKEANPVFEKPTYKEKKSVVVGTMTATLPDGMITASEAHSVDKSSEEFLDKLRAQYSLVAIPSDFEKGFDFYTDGPFCINISKPQQMPQLAALFDTKALKKAGIEMNLEENLVNLVEGLLKQNGRYDENFPAEYVCGGDGFGIVMEQIEEHIDPDDNWSQFVFVIFHKSNVYQGNIYYNVLGERKQFAAAAKEWLKTFKVADKKSLEEYERKQLAEGLKACDLSAKNGDVDAVKVSQMFFDDIAFMNDYDVSYDGKHHKVKQLQFNADVRDKYPVILSYMDVIWPSILKLMAAVEKKESLIIKKNDYHDNLQEVTWKQDITGITVFNLCAAHMLKIVKGEGDNYIVMIDSNLIKGIPAAYAYVAEFIQVLRNYNGTTGPFTAVMTSFSNQYGGIEKAIRSPVKGAAKQEDTVTMSVAKGEFPYTKHLKEKKEEESNAEEQYYLNLAKWRDTCRAIRQKRKDTVEEQILVEKTGLEAEALKKRDDAIAPEEKTIAEQTGRKREAEAKLASLGLFKFAEKKEQKQIIEEAETLIAQAEKAKELAHSSYQSEISSIANKISKKKSQLRAEVKSKMPLPNEPEMPRSMLLSMTFEQRMFEDNRRAILKHMDEDRKYSVTELQEIVPEIRDCSWRMANEIVQGLADAGILVRRQVKRNTYFQIKVE